MTYFVSISEHIGNTSRIQLEGNLWGDFRHLEMQELQNKSSLLLLLWTEILIVPRKDREMKKTTTTL